jgi:hypothetical protein
MSEQDIWEKENQHNITGWETHFSKEISKGVWERYDGFKIVIFNMKDKSTKEFKIYTK